MTDKDQKPTAPYCCLGRRPTRRIRPAQCFPSVKRCRPGRRFVARSRVLSDRMSRCRRCIPALKVGGKKLYELAREGKTVERQARFVQIYDIKIEEIRLPRVALTVSCSKGTYIRTLCHDIGEKLGCGGCMESLLRTRVGAFAQEESLRLSEIETLAKDGRLEGKKSFRWRRCSHSTRHFA